MSGLLGQVLQAGGGQALEMLGGRFGLGPAQTRSALDALLPMVAGGLKRQADSGGGLEGLLGSVLNQGHVAYGDQPEVLARPGTTAAGNEILGAIFDNNRDISRAVAAQAAQSTGIDVGILKQMLPVVAMMAAGALAKNANAGGLGGLLGALGGAGGAGGALASVLGGLAGGQPGAPAPAPAPAQSAGGTLGSLASMLDMDRDGNPLDDILGMLSRR